MKTLCGILQQTCIERLGFFRNVHRERHLDGATQQGTNVLHQGTAYTEASSRRSHRQDVKVSGHLRKYKVVLLNFKWEPLNHERATQSHGGFDERLTAKFAPKMTATFDVHFISR